MFVLTIDVDWALEELIQDVVELINERKLHSTFFLTNQINFSKLDNHELAIHPYFNSIGNEETTLKNTIDLLPQKQTKGSRSHKLFHSSSILQLYKKYGIEYDSNYYIPSSTQIEPFMIDWADVLEIPFFFADDAYYDTKNRFDLSDINLDDKGVKVFLFHPFHIFMNTRNSYDYSKHKVYYNNFEYLNKNRNIVTKGTRDIFISLLDYIKKNKIETKTMNEVNNIYRKHIINDL